MDRKREAMNARRNELIVVASLCEKMPNLGGLARTCEIFGVGKLVLPSPDVAKDATFQALAVTADEWVPLDFCPPERTAELLLRLRSEGYTIAALEQSSESVVLGSKPLPARTALLIGNERNGVAPELLAMVDVIIEIEQYGMIRSLNAHVSSSILIQRTVEQLHHNSIE